MTSQSETDQSQFDVFLSYNTLNREAVVEIAAELRKRNLTPWLDFEQIKPGTSIIKALGEPLEKVKVAAVFLGPEGEGPWQTPEIHQLVHKFNDAGHGVIPVLLPGVPDEPTIPWPLRGISRIDLRRGLTSAGIDDLEWGITGRRPDHRDAEHSEGMTRTETPSIYVSFAAKDNLSFGNDLGWVERFVEYLSKAFGEDMPISVRCDKERLSGKLSSEDELAPSVKGADILIRVLSPHSDQDVRCSDELTWFQQGVEWNADHRLAAGDTAQVVDVLKGRGEPTEEIEGVPRVFFHEPAKTDSEEPFSAGGQQDREFWMAFGELIGIIRQSIAARQTESANSGLATETPPLPSLETAEPRGTVYIGYVSELLERGMWTLEELLTERSICIKRLTDHPSDIDLLVDAVTAEAQSADLAIHLMHSQSLGRPLKGEEWTVPQEEFQIVSRLRTGTGSPMRQILWCIDSGEWEPRQAEFLRVIQEQRGSKDTLLVLSNGEMEDLINNIDSRISLPNDSGLEKREVRPLVHVIGLTRDIRDPCVEQAMGWLFDKQRLDICENRLDKNGELEPIEKLPHLQSVDGIMVLCGNDPEQGQELAMQCRDLAQRRHEKPLHVCCYCFAPTKSNGRTRIPDLGIRFENVQVIRDDGSCKTSLLSGFAQRVHAKA